MKPVLLAEDDDFYADLIQHVLDQEGAPLQRVSSVREALDAMQATVPALLIVSSRLPVPDGFALVRAAGEHPGQSHTPILLLADPEDEDDLQNAVQAEVDDLLLKPIVPVELTFRVRRLLAATATS